MNIIYGIHRIFGEQILPILTIITAIVLTVSWKQPSIKNLFARIFPILVDIQATLGLLWFVFLLTQGDSARMLSFPFILHPILGLLSAGIGHMAVKGTGPFRGLGRWAPLAGLIVLLVIVIANVVIARTT